MLPQDKARQVLSDLRDYLGLRTHAAIARRLGVSSHTPYMWIQRGYYDPFLIKEAVPEISGDWLLTGEGEMLTPTNDRTSEELSRLRTTIRRLEMEADAARAAQQRAEKRADTVLEVLEKFTSTATRAAVSREEKPGVKIEL